MKKLISTAIITAVCIFAVVTCANIVAAPKALEDVTPDSLETSILETVVETTVEPVVEETVPVKTESVEETEPVEEVEKPEVVEKIETPVQEEPVVEPVHSHKYAAYTTEATCTEGGYVTYICSCGDAYVGNNVDANGHDYDSVVTDPEIGVAGYTTHTCKNCGDEYVDSYVDALIPEAEPVETDPVGTEAAPVVHEHAYEVSQIVSPGCETSGYTVYQCECGSFYSDDFIGATDHNYVDTVIEPTYEEDGYTEHTCVGCGNSYKDSYTDKLVIRDFDAPIDAIEPIECCFEVACTCSDGHNHAVVTVGCNTFVYCEHIQAPFNGTDGFTIFYPYSFY